MKNLLLLIILLITGQMANSAEVNLAKGRPAYASNQSAFADLPVFVCDGDLNTIWGAGGVRPVWISIDLGSVMNYKEAVIHWHNFAWPKGFELQSSDDGLNWQTIAEVAKKDESIDTVQMNASSRYVRLYSNNREVPMTTAIYEIELLGDEPESCDDTALEVHITNKPETHLNMGADYTLQAAFGTETPCDESINWSSSNEHIAYVNSSGQMKTFAQGSCYITATHWTSGKSDSCLINVQPDSIKVWELKGDYGIVQVEHAQLGYYGPSWYTKSTDFSGYTGDSYLTFQGPAMWPEDKAAYEEITYPRKLTFYVSAPEGGTYYYSMNTYHLKEDGDNDYWRSINKEEWRKTGHNIVKEWSWVGPCGWYKIEGQGPHLIEIAGRSNGMCIDRIAFYRPEVSPGADQCGEDLSAYDWANDPTEADTLYIIDTLPPQGMLINEEKILIYENQIRIAWLSATDNVKIEKYKIYLDGNFYAEAPAVSTLAFIRNLEPGTAYSVTVEAVDWLGNKSMSEAYTFVTEQASSVKVTDLDQVLFYPNPASDLITIKAQGVFTNYEILNLQGQVCLSGILNETSRIALNGLNSKLYMVHLMNEEKHCFKKLVID